MELDAWFWPTDSAETILYTMKLVVRRFEECILSLFELQPLRDSHLKNCLSFSNLDFQRYSEAHGRELDPIPILRLGKAASACSAPMKVGTAALGYRKVVRLALGPIKGHLRPRNTDSRYL